MVVDLKANEMVIKAADSDYITDNLSVKGKFIVTNQRIYFILGDTPKNGFENIEILPDQIKEIIYIKGKKLFSKGLNVVTRDGNSMTFIMKNRNEFGELINKMY
jgi:hypothetical protein